MRGKNNVYAKWCESSQQYDRKLSHNEMMAQTFKSMLGNHRPEWKYVYWHDYGLEKNMGHITKDRAISILWDAQVVREKERLVQAKSCQHFSKEKCLHPELEPGTFLSRFRRLNHSTTAPTRLTTTSFYDFYNTKLKRYLG